MGINALRDTKATTWVYGCDHTSELVMGLRFSSRSRRDMYIDLAILFTKSLSFQLSGQYSQGREELQQTECFLRGILFFFPFPLTFYFIGCLGFAYYLQLSLPRWANIQLRITTKRYEPNPSEVLHLSRHHLASAGQLPVTNIFRIWTSATWEIHQERHPIASGNSACQVIMVLRMYIEQGSLV